MTARATKTATREEAVRMVAMEAAAAMAVVMTAGGGGTAEVAMEVGPHTCIHRMLDLIGEARTLVPPRPREII